MSNTNNKPRKNGQYNVAYSRAKSREVNQGTATYTRGKGWSNVRGPYGRAVSNPTIYAWE